MARTQLVIPVCPLCAYPMLGTAQGRYWKQSDGLNRVESWACPNCPFTITEGYLSRFRGGLLQKPRSLEEEERIIREDHPRATSTRVILFEDGDP